FRTDDRPATRPNREAAILLNRTNTFSRKSGPEDRARGAAPAGSDRLPSGRTMQTSTTWPNVRLQALEQRPSRLRRRHARALLYRRTGYAIPGAERQQLSRSRYGDPATEVRGRTRLRVL